MRSVALTVCALAVSATFVSAAGTGNFVTSGGKIYDPSGNQYVARGVNIPGYNYWTGHNPVGDVSMVVDNWGFNMVRVVNLPTASWRGPGWQNNVDDIIAAYTARNVVTVIEVHEATGSYFEGQQLADTAAWFAGLAARHRSNPYVWFNTSNEPGNMQKPANPADAPDWDMWTPDGEKFLHMNRTIIDAIRSTGSRSPILVDGTNFGQDQAWDDLGNLNPKHSAILTHGPTLSSEYENLIFDTHIYGEWTSPGAVPGRLRKYIEAVQAADLPLIFGEYGSTVYGDWAQIQVDFLKIANEYDIGRLAWAWADVGGWQLTTGRDPNAIGTTWEHGGGYLIDHPTHPTNLSDFGQLVWTDNHTFIPIPEPAAGLTALAATALLATTRRRRRAA